MSTRFNLFAMLLAAAAVFPAAGETDFKDYVNGTADAPATHDTWGVFLGMTQTESNIDAFLERQIREGKWINPFTGLPLWSAPVFVFGQDNKALELLRVITDHLDVHALSDWGAIKESRHSFDYIICHSNGCTAAISAVMSGDVSVKHIFAMGTDWTTASLDPSRMHGTEITFFVNRTDPVPMIPGISLQRASENTPGVGFTLPFNDLRDLTRQLGNLVGGKQPDTVRYDLIRMDPRPGLILLKAHDLTDSYFPNVRDWLSRGGVAQQQLRTLLKPPSPAPAALPFRSVSPPTSTATTPITLHDRGGVFAGIDISDVDFAPTKGAKK